MLDAGLAIDEVLAESGGLGVSQLPMGFSSASLAHLLK